MRECQKFNRYMTALAIRFETIVEYARRLNEKNTSLDFVHLNEKISIKFSL